MPDWWNKRRYGMFVTANIATVPSFAPIGEYAEWYWSHLGTDVLKDVQLHPVPAVEVLAYHRDRWSHVERMDDFIPFLSFHRFDADELLELATAAGMKYLVHITKHHDGFCWWDAPLTDRTSVRSGPRRNVMAEIAQACRRSDVVFGTYYSLLDWADPRYPHQAYVDQVLHPQVLDLVGRYGSQILWGDGHWGHGPDVWRTEELVERACELAQMQGHELAINDRWWHPTPTFTTPEYNPPDDIGTTPWELCRGVGHSFGNNRVERAEHMLSSGALLDLLTETIAKGGNLLLGVGPGVDGRVPDLQQHPLREVGRWVDQHVDVIHNSTPFDHWGDSQTRFVRVQGRVVAIDLAATDTTTLSGLSANDYTVTAVTSSDGGAVHWEQHSNGLVIQRTDRTPVGLAAVYNVALTPAFEKITLFPPAGSTIKQVQPLLTDAQPGTIVQLGDGVYQGPISVPAGVTLRGMGWDRTAIVGTGLLVADLAAGSRLEHVRVSGGPERFFNFAAPQINASGAGAAVIGCKVDGHVLITGDDVVVQSLVGPGVVGFGQRSVIERCTLKGMRWDVGIDLYHGSGHRVSNNEVVDHLCNIRLTDISATRVESNRCTGRWWAIHLAQCDHVEVADNSIQHSMRAINVTGGNGSAVLANWVSDGDSGCLVEFGATDTDVIDNRIERCRVGLLLWDAPTTRIGPNTFLDLHGDEEVVTGPDQ